MARGEADYWHHSEVGCFPVTVDPRLISLNPSQVTNHKNCDS